MSPSFDERAPLLQFPSSNGGRQDTERKPVSKSSGPYGGRQEIAIVDLPDAYNQFCRLIGNPPFDHPPGKKHVPPKDSLYNRAVNHRKYQERMYYFSSTLTNTLLLSQIVLGATLTGLGASDQSRVLITIFGALNTVIAGLVAFLKSRGQPMRARMFRDDLDRVVDEIENSAVMWKGISQKVHGYDAIDTDESVTVRSEVARLTRLYDRAVKTNTMNDPDFYGSGISMDGHNTGGLRGRTEATPAAVPIPAAPLPSAATPAAAPVPAPEPAADPDESPATKAPAKKDEPPAAVSIADTPAPSDISKAVEGKPQLAEDLLKTIESTHGPSSGAPAPAADQMQPAPPPPTTAAVDPDESPATSAKLVRSKSNKDKESKAQEALASNTRKVTEDLSGT